MPSPMSIVVGLTIMWLIVVGPMIVRRPAGERQATRRRMPTAEEEAVQDHQESSEARRQMMSRRRRSLTVLIVGFALSVSLALLRGGVAWPVAVAFAGGLGGYLYFLRTQARRDRERRQFRQPHDDQEEEATPVQAEAETDGPATRPAVLIDDDDPALESMDTIDLTGVYEQATVVTAQRRAG
jgi:uncharacterized protein HemX